MSEGQGNRAIGERALRKWSAYLCRTALLLGLMLAFRSIQSQLTTAPARPGMVHQKGPSEEVASLAIRLRSHVEELCRAPGRSWRHPKSLARIASLIENAWRRAGWDVERQPIPGLGDDYVNLTAFPDSARWDGAPVLIGAHYDAVEGTPGADDNASSVAVLMELPRLLAAHSGALSRPAVLAAFTLEEPPFFQTAKQGSRVLVSSLRAAGVRLHGAVVLEMVGYYRQEQGSQHYPFPLGLLGYPSRADFCGLVANRKSRGLIPHLKASIEAAGMQTETLAVPGRGHLLPPIRLSDHASFWDAGFRALMVTDTSFYRNPYYHTPADLPHTLDYESLARLTLGLAGFLEGR